MLFFLISPRPDKQDERAAKVANFLYRWINFYVNNPKTADEIFSTEINFPPLTLFKGGVTLVNRILCIFAAKIRLKQVFNNYITN